MAPASSIPAIQVRGALKGLKKMGIIREISVEGLIGSDRIRTEALIFCFDAFSSREPASTPHQVRGRLSHENTLTATLNQKR
jgi:hypothetical protein